MTRIGSQRQRKKKNNLHRNGSPQIKHPTLSTVTQRTQNKEGIDCPVETESN